MFRPGRQQQQEEGGLTEEVLHIRRVSRKTVGGNYVTFSVLVGVGDKKGSFGLGLAKATEVPIAIQKATKQARKHMIKANLNGATIPCDIDVKYGAAKILLKPAPPGTGLKAGSVVRQILSLIGVKDISAKLYGSSNRLNLSRAVFRAFEQMRQL